MIALHRILLAAAASATFGAASVAPAAADTDFVALSGERSLSLIDFDRKRVIDKVDVKGVSGRLLGFDVRPADGQLYAVSVGGQIVTINTKNGTATPKSTLSQAFPSGAQASLDFNPALDALRMIGTDGTNWSVNVDTGVVAVQAPMNFAAGNPFGGTGTPAVVAAAYLNNVKGSKATFLFDIERATKAIYLQIPPPTGTLYPAGLVSLNLANLGFDIFTDSRLRNTPYVANQGRILQIQTTSGVTVAHTRIAGLPNNVRDLAVLPSFSK